MFFPFFYTGELAVYKPQDFDQALVSNQLVVLFGVSAVIDNTYHFAAPLSYTKLPIKGVLVLIDDPAGITFKYKVSLLECNLLFALGMVFFGFFFFFNDAFFAVLSGLVGLSAYIFNAFKISNTIKRNIFKIIGVSNDLGEHKLWRMQQQWMNDPLVCPACGETINNYAANCLNCGLSFQKKKKQPAPTNTTGVQEINYQIKKGE